MRWPKYKNAYLMAFEKMLQARIEAHEKDPSKSIWNRTHTGYIDAKGIFNWWMENGVLVGQFNLFEDYEDEEEYDD